MGATSLLCRSAKENKRSKKLKPHGVVLYRSWKKGVWEIELRVSPVSVARSSK